MSDPVIEVENASQRKSRRTKWGLVITGAAIAIVVGFFVLVDEPEKKKSLKSVKAATYIPPGSQVNAADAWRATSEGRFNEQDSRIGKAQEKLDKLEQLMSKGGSPAVSPIVSSPTPVPTDQADLDARLSEYAKSRQIPGNPQISASVPTANVQKRPLIANGAQQPMPESRYGMIPQVSVTRVELPKSEPSIQGLKRISSQSQDVLLDKPGLPDELSTFIPRGSFGKAVVLGGAYVPTGGLAQSNPKPMLLQLKDVARMPNYATYNWRECLLTASATGNLSAERASIRLESLSCVAEDGRVIDVDLKGYVSGEDGKEGMRGPIVEKRGAALRNAMIASLVSGVGGAIGNAAQTTNTTALGSVTTVSPGEGFRLGVGQSLQRSSEKLADYYLKLAESLFPVIEIDAGRVVDIVLLKSVTIEAS